MQDPPGSRRVHTRWAIAGLLAVFLVAPACSPPVAQGPVRNAFLPETNPFAGVPHVPGIGNEGGELLGAAPAEPVRETVRFASNDADLFGGHPTIIEAELYRPVGKGPFPALVALHDCMGLYGPNGKVNSHMRDWAERLSAQGYAVLMPDSLNPRGMPENCDRDPELVRPGVERARDAAASLDWLQAQPWASGDRVGLIGWASGGTAALTFATSDGRLRGRNFDFRLIVAFYPNCSALKQAPGWRSDIKLTVFVGGNDNWAPAPECVALVDQVAQAGGVLDLVKYKAAAHDFDWPGMPLHMKAGLTMTATGTAVIGTDSQARADAVTRVSHLFADSLHP